MLEVDIINHGNFRCYFCYSPDSPTCTQSIIYCSGCLLVYYCSADCLNDDRRTHEPVCNEFPAVNGNSVLHNHKIRTWKKHITALRERAARLPLAISASNPIFRNPKVCHACKEAQTDLLKVCKCGCVCYCSEICAHTDKLHQKSCKNLRSLTESLSLSKMRESYPESLSNAYDNIDEYGPNKCPKDDLITLNIHIITSTSYSDAASWEYIFQDFPKLEQLNLIFVIQGMAYNPSYDKSEILTELAGNYSDYCETENCSITYSVHQKPYHMFFSSSEYTEPDIVVAYGIPYTNNDIHSEISYRNMTYCKHTILVLMGSTKELVAMGVNAVKAAQPINVMMPPQRNRLRGFGSHFSEMDFDVSAPNVKRYITCLYRD